MQIKIKREQFYLVASRTAAVVYLASIAVNIAALAAESLRLKRALTS